MAKTQAAMGEAEQIIIQPARFATIELLIRGTAPYVQQKFSVKSRDQIQKKQEEGQAAKSKNKRTKKDFEAHYRDAQLMSTDGKNGIAANAFRNAMISACRVAGMVMTRAKLAVFIDPDGFDTVDEMPMVYFKKGKPKMLMSVARLPNGSPNLVARPRWKTGWEVKLRVNFDLDVVSPSSLVNLLARAGRQVGIGEGRPDSKKSAGCGWGTFEIVGDTDKITGNIGPEEAAV